MKPRLLYVVTHPVTAASFLRGQLTFMREHGFEVTVIASPGPDLDVVAERENVAVRGVRMAREPTKDDAASLAALVRAMRQVRPDIVNASTPKASLLGLVAARVLRVPRRIYLNRGLRLETASGTLKKVLGATERIASRCATDVVCVSRSVERAMVDGGYAPAAKTRVLGGGSSNGVDVARFEATPARRQEGRARLAALGVAADDPVVLFVGRAVKDKGIADLLDAFERVRARVPRAKLVIVGESFADDADEELTRRVRAAPGVVSAGRSNDVPPFYAAADVLAFPSAREGFPNAPLEAAAAARPVVAYSATGTVDAVVDGKTGRLVAQGDSAGLAAGLVAYLESPAEACAHGDAGRARAVAEFSNERVWAAWLDFYRGEVDEVRSRARRSGG